MSGNDLREIAVAMYGDRGWQKRLAAALGVDPSTVRRWVEMDHVPILASYATKWLNHIHLNDPGSSSR